MAEWQPVVESLVAERGARLVAYGRMLAPRPSDAEDLVHDALVKAFTKRRGPMNVGEAEQYTRRAMQTLAIDRARSRQARQRAVDKAFEREDQGPNPDDRMDVHAALRELSPRERVCTVMRYFDDLPIRAIAEDLGLAEGTVKRYLSNASARLAEILDVDMPDVDGAGDHTSEVIPIRTTGRSR